MVHDAARNAAFGAVDIDVDSAVGDTVYDAVHGAVTEPGDDEVRRAVSDEAWGVSPRLSVRDPIFRMGYIDTHLAAFRATTFAPRNAVEGGVERVVRGMTDGVGEVVYAVVDDLVDDITFGRRVP